MTKDKKKQNKRRVYTFGKLQNSLNEEREWVHLDEKEQKGDKQLDKKEQKQTANFYTQFIQKNKEDLEETQKKEGNKKIDKNTKEQINKKTAFLKESTRRKFFIFLSWKNKFNYLLEQRKQHFKNLQNSKILETDLKIEEKDLKQKLLQEEEKTILLKNILMLRKIYTDF